MHGNERHLVTGGYAGDFRFGFRARDVVDDTRAEVFERFSITPARKVSIDTAVSGKFFADDLQRRGESAELLPRGDVVRSRTRRIPADVQNGGAFRYGLPHPAFDRIRFLSPAAAEKRIGVTLTIAMTTGFQG